MSDDFARIHRLEADLDDKEAECRYLRGELNMTKAKLVKALDALSKACALLYSDEKDSAKGTLKYHIVTTYLELKRKDQ